MDKKEEWQQIKGDPEIHDAHKARSRDTYQKNLEKERERSRQRYQKNKEKEKARHRAHYAKNREKWREYSRKKRALHADRERATDRAYYATHKEKFAEKEKHRKDRTGPNREQWLKLLRYARHAHYLTREQYEEIYPRLANGPCEICGVEGKMTIDHCHEQNIYRGLLCDGCNRGLGFFKENVMALRQAIDYLDKAGV